MRGIFDLHAEDWLERLGIPRGTRIKVADSDVSSVAARTDKVFQVLAAIPFILHFECQVSYDPALIRRMLRYNALLHELHGIPIMSVLILLCRGASGPNYTGHLRYGVEGHPDSVDFRYPIIRVWEIDEDELLQSGPGLQALALLTDGAAKDPRATVLKLAQNLSHRKDWKRIKEWAFSLAGIRYTRPQLGQMFKGVEDMLTFDDVLKVSSAKSAIVGYATKKGIEKGRKEGLKRCLQSLIHLGTILWGDLTPAQHARIMKIKDVSTLDQLEIRARSASSWKELLATLK